MKRTLNGGGSITQKMKSGQSTCQEDGWVDMFSSMMMISFKSMTKKNLKLIPLMKFH